MAEKISNTVSPSSKIARCLPIDYKLSENDVYVGRANLYRLHPGNLRFNDIVQANLDRYCNATNRKKKTSIIYEVVDQVRASSIDGGFVKRSKKNGRWYEVGDIVARERTSQAFRDATVGVYKSSRNTALKPTPSQKVRSIEDNWSPKPTNSVKEEVMSFLPNPYNCKVDVGSNWNNFSSHRCASDDRLNDRISLPVAKSISSFDDVYNIDGNTVMSSQLQQESSTRKSDDRKMSPFEQKTYMNRNTNIHCSESSYTNSSNDSIRLDQKDDNLLAPFATTTGSHQLIESNVYQLTMTESMSRFDRPSNATVEPTTARTDTPATTTASTTSSVAKSDQETFDLLLKLFQK